MHIRMQENINLAQFSTLHIGGPAKYFIEVTDEYKLIEAWQFAKDRLLGVFILGGGSNIVINDKGFTGLVIKINNKGLEIEKETDTQVIIKVAAGEVWDDIVKFAVAHQWWGIENLSNIPGRVGAAPIQNIGAYGQEVSQAIKGVRVFDRQDNLIKTLDKEQCGFAYRRSVFNFDELDRYIVLAVILALHKNGRPVLNYPDLSSWVNRLDKAPSLSDIRHEVIEIRQGKFADPGKVGTAGSFFKNLNLDEEKYNNLEAKIKANYSDEILGKLIVIKNKFTSDKGIKIPTAFLIDQVLSLKGLKIGGAEISSTQALAIINPNKKATAKDVLSLFKKVRQEVFCKTGMVLDVEPKLVGFSVEELKEYYSLSDC